jgi:hypothetical protein
MKIVNLKTFLAYPDGVVFAEFTPCILGDIEVRGQVWMNDKLSSCAYQHFGLFDTEDSLASVDCETEVVTDYYFRRGPGLNVDQLFAVFDKKDLTTVIERLQRAVDEAKE